MLTFLASALVSLSLMFGAPAPTVPADRPLEAAQEAAQGTCMEDMECWDADTMGNGEQSNISPSELDAWKSVGSRNIVPASPNQALEYVETLDYMPTSFPAGYFAVGSNTSPQVHVMKWVTLHFA